MKQPLIHTRPSPILRAVDVLVTVLAWACFLYLCVRGVTALVQYRPPDMGGRFDTLRATVDTLMWYFVIGAFNASVLAAWAIYNQVRRRVERRRVERRSVIPALDDAKLSDSFQLTPERLRSLQSHQVVVVHNDEHGGIARVVPVLQSGAGVHSTPANDAHGAKSAGGRKRA